jgi:hypothetical protein
MERSTACSSPSGTAYPTRHPPPDYAAAAHPRLSCFRPASTAHPGPAQPPIGEGTGFPAASAVVPGSRLVVLSDGASMQLPGDAQLSYRTSWGSWRARGDPVSGRRPSSRPSRRCRPLEFDDDCTLLSWSSTDAVSAGCCRSGHPLTRLSWMPSATRRAVPRGVATATPWETVMNMNVTPDVPKRLVEGFCLPPSRRRQPPSTAGEPAFGMWASWAPARWNSLLGPPGRGRPARGG